MEGRSGADKFYAVSLLAMAMFYAGAAGANPAHEQLMRMSDSDRNIALTRYLKASGQKCDLVTRNFFQGKGKKGNAFWNVQCGNGQAYVIQVENDSVGSTNVMNCSLLKAINAGECFKKF